MRVGISTLPGVEGDIATPGRKPRDGHLPSQMKTAGGGGWGTLICEANGNFFGTRAPPPLLLPPPPTLPPTLLRGWARRAPRPGFQLSFTGYAVVLSPSTLDPPTPAGDGTVLLSCCSNSELREVHTPYPYTHRHQSFRRCLFVFYFVAASTCI